MNKNKEILEYFPEGIIVESIIGEGGPSAVFIGDSGHTQPFSYLDDYNPEHYRIVTKEEFEDPDELIKKQSTDAYRWARSFMSMIEKGHFTKEDIDEGLMISWFANAIETAKDSLHKHFAAKDELIEKLWRIIDDIDTIGDIAKSDDKLYRAMVERKQAERWGLPITSDGYSLTISDTSVGETNE